MKAWRVYGAREMRLDDVPYPKLELDSVIVKVKTVQVSVTEAQQFYSDFLASEKWVKRFKDEGPRLMYGHEFSGEIVEIGKNVKDFKISDHVFWGKSQPCGECEACQAGYGLYCTNHKLIGFHVPGCLAEYSTIDAAFLVKAQNCTDSEVAALQPITAALSGLVSAEMSIGDTVVVFGLGVMGLLTAQLCKAAGASTIIGVDIREESLRLGHELGVDIVVNAKKINPINEIQNATGNFGVDVVFECAGGSTRVGLAGTKTLAQAGSAAHPGGKVVISSIPEPDAKLDLTPLTSKNIQYRGRGHQTEEQLQWAIHLVETGQVKIAPLVTHVLDGIDKVPEAIEITLHKGKYAAIGPAQVVISI
jgi:threonine dehydrogenase-like Zn-dependent dehydrogenase